MLTYPCAWNCTSGVPGPVLPSLTAVTAAMTASPCGFMTGKYLTICSPTVMAFWTCMKSSSPKHAVRACQVSSVKALVLDDLYNSPD